MPKIEIYKLKKTVAPNVRKYGMFEFFGMGEGPIPGNYVREWSGELPVNDLETLLGRFVLNPPAGYHGGPLHHSDIAVLNGTAYFFDRGHEFAEIPFDTSAVKDAIHVEYGYSVDTEEAWPISRQLAEVCEKLDIPIGYIDSPDYHGSHKGEEPFIRTATRWSEFSPRLHPQFLKGEDAKAFTSLLAGLLKNGRWEEIAAHLRARYPIYMADLVSVCKQFAPELLRPAEACALPKESIVAKIQEARAAAKTDQQPHNEERSGHSKSYREER